MHFFLENATFAEPNDHPERVGAPRRIQQAEKERLSVENKASLSGDSGAG